MKNLGTILAALVLSALVALGVTGLHQSPQPQEQPGATTPIVSSPYFQFGGVTSFRYHQVMKTATTTLCAVQSPAATSSVRFVMPQITTGTSTAAAITIATSTSQYATTTTGTLDKDHSVGSGAQDSWAFAGANNSITGPNTWVLVGTAGAGLGGYTYTGSCDVEFTVL